MPPCDAALLEPDLATNEASALILREAGALSKKEGARIARALLGLGEVIRRGEFSLDPALEDVHINLETALGKLAGEVAGKLHAGRSRNDQVACDIRLWHRDRILAHLENMVLAIGLMLDRAEEEKNTTMPGFSHHQRAFITTFGHLLASYAEARSRDLARGREVFERTNRCPLGAAAGFGTSWPIDRELAAKLLGFEGLVENSLDAVTSRVEVETDVAIWLAMWMTHCATLAQDLILFSMEEFRWIRLAPETTTGSSIMPQKRNPDFAEVIKAKASVVHGALASLLSLAKGQPSGYHRDSQLSKPLGQDIWREVESIPEVLGLVFRTMKPDRKRMREAVSGGFLEAAEWADAIAQESGLPFRSVYTAVGVAVDRARGAGRLDRKTVNSTLTEHGIDFQVNAGLEKRLSRPEALLANRLTLGSPNPKRVEEHVARLRDELEKRGREIARKKRAVARAEKDRRARLVEVSKGL